MTGNYLTIKREPRTIDPRKCDATKGKRTFAKLPRDDWWGRCNYIWPLFITNIFLKLKRDAPGHVLYIIHERRIKRKAPALLWPFTNHEVTNKPPPLIMAACFNYSPHHNADLLFPECRCLKVMAAFQHCIPSRTLCIWPFAVTSLDQMDLYAKNCKSCADERHK